VLGIEYLLDAALLEMRVVANDIDKEASGDPKQQRSAIHVNRDQAVGPCG